MQLNLEKDYYVHNYNLDNIKNGIVFIIGRRCSGRTTLVKDILIQKRGYPIGRIFTMTEWDQNYYSEFCDKTNITIRYNSYLLKEVIDKQKKNNKDMRIIIFDDALSIKCDWVEDEDMAELLNKSKELNILAIFCFQFSFNHQKLAESVDQVFMLEEDFSNHKERLYKYYASDIYKEYKDFDRLLQRVNKDDKYNTVVIDKKAYANPTNVNEVVFKYKAIDVKLKAYKKSDETRIYDSDSDSTESKEKEASIIRYKDDSSDSEESSDSDVSSKSNIKSLSYYFGSLGKKATSVDSSKIKIDLKNNNVTIFKDDKEIEITF
jgi:hypothetical protein